MRVRYTARDGGRGLVAAAARVESADAERDLIVFGHSHVATLERLPGGAVYANPGSWLDAPTFLHVTENRIALRQWNGSAESADLNAFDRPAKEALAQLKKL
jgi:predicted phosphodiesterase